MSEFQSQSPVESGKATKTESSETVGDVLKRLFEGLKAKEAELLTLRNDNLQAAADLGGEEGKAGVAKQTGIDKEFQAYFSKKSAIEKQMAQAA